MKNNLPLVSIGVLINKEGKILLGKRKGSAGAGEWGLPGGHFEYMENFEEAVQREVLEETDMTIKNIKFCLLANIKKLNPKHYVYVGFTADWESGEERLKEPNKCEGWIWTTLHKMPKGVRTIPDLYVQALNTGKNYFPEV